MNIVADESVDRQIVERLRAGGHHVLFVAELDPGISDGAVLARSRDENALLLTADKDFGDLVFRQRLLHSGVLLIRLAGTDAVAKAEMVSAEVRQHGEELKHAFAVLSTRALRLRKLRS